MGLVYEKRSFRTMFAARVVTPKGLLAEYDAA
jgi:hypothetical protein